MDKVEEDLIRSRSLRESQAKDFSEQLDALRQKYEQQVCMFCICMNVKLLRLCARDAARGKPLLPPSSALHCYLFVISEHMAHWSQRTDIHLE